MTLQKFSFVVLLLLLEALTLRSTFSSYHVFIIILSYLIDKYQICIACKIFVVWYLFFRSTYFLSLCCCLLWFFFVSSFLMNLCVAKCVHLWSQMNHIFYKYKYCAINIDKCYFHFAMSLLSGTDNRLTSYIHKKNIDSFDS